MKKTLFILAIAALAVSCAKEIATEAPVAGNKVTIRVSMPEEPFSKVSLTEADDNQSIALAWEAGDKISVNGLPYTIKEGFSAHEAEFEGEEPAETEFTIIYPGKYASIDDFNARSYAEQAQTGNSSTAHLEYNAALVGVGEYTAPKFDPEWAADNGGSLIQNAVVQLRLQLPADATDATSVTLSASRAIFPTTNAGGTLVKEQTLALNNVTLPANKILEAYMMVSAAGVEILSGDELTVIVGTSAGIFLRKITLEAQTWTGGGQYTLQLKVQDENRFEISTVEDLKEFRDGVNSGDMLWQNVHAVLLNDLDCSGITSWTPIGNGTFNNSDYTISGPAFRGIFEGGDHVLQHFSFNGTPAAGGTYGFFGVLDGATVTQLTFGVGEEDGVFNVTPSGMMAAGVLAGVARSSTIEEVTNNSPMNIPENTSSSPAYFGMIGYLLGTPDGPVHLNGLSNYGEINVKSESNTQNNSNGFQVAAVAGFSHTTSSDIKNLLENCNNYGKITTTSGRSAGILAAANDRTDIEHCLNAADITNTCGNCRMGGVTVILGNGGSMKDCSNYGTLVCTKSDGQVGGLICLVNHTAVSVTGGGNHGLIVSDLATYRGTLIANINTVNKVDDMVAGGAVANYNGGEFQYPVIITEDNYMSYIGVIKSGMESKVTNISFEAWDQYPADNTIYISNAAELLAFAAKVNAGEVSATDVVKLTADIDCSSISNWSPIGDYKMTAWTHVNLTGSGHPFFGTFDGQGHSIKNLSMSFSNSGSWNAYGFFACIGDGATVKNLTFDASCSMSVSASYGGTFGVLAGMVLGATVENVKNYASVTGGGTSSLVNDNAAGRTMVGAIIGEVHVSSASASLTGLHNYGAIGSAAQIFSRGGNAGTGGNGFHVGGIVGFSTNTNNSVVVNFKDCVNDGDIYTDAARSSGIVAAANRYTVLKSCTNNGDVTNSYSGAARMANITCIAAAGCVLEDVCNTGDLIAPNAASAAGVICLVNDNSVKLTRCSSIGATIVCTGFNTANNSVNYAGALYGRCQKTATFSGCSVSGKVGNSTDALLTLTADNYFPFVGEAYSSNTTINSTNITFAGE